MYLGCFCLSPSHLMRFPITATIESARFSARIHSALTTYKKREAAGGFASRGAVEKWEYFYNR